VATLKWDGGGSGTAKTGNGIAPQINDIRVHINLKIAKLDLIWTEICANMKLIKTGTQLDLPLFKTGLARTSMCSNEGPIM
jgi:hypothetical protein